MTSATRLLSALLATSVVGAAHAAAPSASVRLEVRAASDCTSQSDLAARILARLRRTRFVDDASALGVRAQFTTLTSGNVAVDLTLTKAGAKPSARRLVARSCTQAADAAALIVAVTLDPTSISEAARSEDATTTEEPEGPPTNSNPDTNSNGESTDATQTPIAPSRDSAERALANGGPRRIEARSKASHGGRIAAEPSQIWTGSPRFGAQVAAGLFGGVAPTLLPGVAFYALAGLDRETLWSPAVVLGASHGFDASVEATGGTATFWLDAATLDACALRVSVRSFEARACASALAGRLSASASDTSNPAGTVRRPFASAGAAAVMALRVERTLEVTARASLGANLIRDSFEFVPFVFHDVPRLMLGASVGIGIRSP